MIEFTISVIGVSIVVPTNLSSGSPEDRELSLSACAWRSAKRH